MAAFSTPELQLQMLPMFVLCLKAWLSMPWKPTVGGASISIGFFFFFEVDLGEDP